MTEQTKVDTPAQDTESTNSATADTEKKALRVRDDEVEVEGGLVEDS